MFETKEMSQSKASKFKKWFNKMIGTDYEENVGEKCGSRYYILLDLYPEEEILVREYLK